MAAETNSTLFSLPSALEYFLCEHSESLELIHGFAQSISESVSKGDLETLMDHDEDDPHGIVALGPDEVTPCAEIIRGYGEAAVACMAELDAFTKAKEKDLERLRKPCSQEAYAELQGKLVASLNKEMSAVKEKKMALEEYMDDKHCFTDALLLRLSQEEVDNIDEDCLEKEYEDARIQLQEEHVQRAHEGVGLLLPLGKLPFLHDQVQEIAPSMEALKQKAMGVTAEHDTAKSLHASLEQQKAKLHEKMQSCTALRKKTVKKEMAKREALETIGKAFHKALDEYKHAHVQNEAAAIMEAGSGT